MTATSWITNRRRRPGKPATQPAPDHPGGTACSVRSLSVHFPVSNGRLLRALDNVCLDIHRGETLGIVGESGSGKSMLGMSLLGLVPSPGQVSGEIRIGGTDVVTASRRDLYALRGRTVGLVLQDPTASLNPLRTIESQLAESLRRIGVTGAPARTEMTGTLERVGIQASDVLRSRPFELSGGMNQRIALAMAVLQRPQILVADEPTTALDVVVQLEVLQLLRSLQRERHMTLILISHDLSVVNQLADRVAVFYSGKLVELGTTGEISSAAAHPYTRALLKTLPVMSETPSDLAPIQGQFHTSYAGDQGCPFTGRCPAALSRCAAEFPGHTALSPTHGTWCWLHSPETPQP